MSTANAMPPTGADDNKNITFFLEANDGILIPIDKEAALQSQTLEDMIGASNMEEGSTIPIKDVNGWTIQKIVDWCKAHRGEVYKAKEAHEDPRVQLTEEHKAYLDVTSDQLFDLLIAAEFFNIQKITDIITQKIANMAIDKSVEEIREIYGLENNFSPEELEELRQKLAWVDA